MAQDGKLPNAITSATIRGVSLVKCYFATFASVAEGLRHLNEQLGTNYQHGQKSRWENGIKEPSRLARAVMMHRVLPGVLKEHGKATEEDVNNALDKLL